MSLKIGIERALPLKFLSTSFGRVLFEEATAAGVVCGAIDLKGDFKSTANGQGDGIPIVIFGGEHQDVPLDENGGTSLAEIVVELRQPFVVDLEQLSIGTPCPPAGPRRRSVQARLRARMNGSPISRMSTSVEDGCRRV